MGMWLIKTSKENIFNILEIIVSMLRPKFPYFWIYILYFYSPAFRPFEGPSLDPPTAKYEPLFVWRWDMWWWPTPPKPILEFLHAQKCATNLHKLLASLLCAHLMWSSEEVLMRCVHNLSWKWEATIDMLFKVIWYFRSYGKLWMTLLMNKWTTLSWMVHEFVHWPKPYLLMSATYDEILSWIAETWMKNYLISDSNCNTTNL